MRLRFDLEVGPLSITFDPWPEEEDEPEDEQPVIQGIGAADTVTDLTGSYGNPEMHMGFRGGYYEE